MRTCIVAGCHGTAATYSHLCPAHRERDRTHGHPLQRGVTKAELKPYRKAVRKYLQERAGKNADAINSKAWASTVQQARERVERYQRGKADVKWDVLAAELVLAINREVEPREIAEVLMALGYWYRLEPKRWASDDGFKFQCARMFRRLAPSTGRYNWRPDGSLARSSYPRVPKRLMYATYAIIHELQFVGWGMLMADEDRKAADLKRRDTIAERTAILGPLASLQTTLI